MLYFPNTSKLWIEKNHIEKSLTKDYHSSMNTTEQEVVKEGNPQRRAHGAQISLTVINWLHLALRIESIFYITFLMLYSLIFFSFMREIQKNKWFLISNCFVQAGNRVLNDQHLPSLFNEAPINPINKKAQNELSNQQEFRNNTQNVNIINSSISSGKIPQNGTISIIKCIRSKITIHNTQSQNNPLNQQQRSKQNNRIEKFIILNIRITTHNNSLSNHNSKLESKGSEVYSLEPGDIIEEGIGRIEGVIDTHTRLSIPGENKVEEVEMAEYQACPHKIENYPVTDVEVILPMLVVVYRMNKVKAVHLPPFDEQDDDEGEQSTHQKPNPSRTPIIHKLTIHRTLSISINITAQTYQILHPSVGLIELCLEGIGIGGSDGIVYSSNGCIVRMEEILICQEEHLILDEEKVEYEQIEQQNNKELSA